jgi:hypothetical protein
MPHPKDDPKSSEWRPYIFARDQWHCRICGDRFLYSEMVRKHIADEHDENMPPSMYEYFRGAVWQRKKISWLKNWIPLEPADNGELDDQLAQAKKMSISLRQARRASPSVKVGHGLIG